MLLLGGCCFCCPPQPSVGLSVGWRARLCVGVGIALACLEQAEFCRQFEDKTGNYFGTPFEKLPGKYNLVEIGA